MFEDKKVVVVMPAYNAAQTLRQTYEEVMAQNIVDLVIIVDDASSDETAAIAAKLPNTVVHTHPSNLGYAPIRNPVTLWRWNTVPISLLWCIPIISTRQS